MEIDIHTAPLKELFDEHMKTKKGGERTGYSRAQGFIRDFATILERRYVRPAVVADLLEMEVWYGYNIVHIRHKSDDFRINVGAATIEKIQAELERLTGERMVRRRSTSKNRGQIF